MVPLVAVVKGTRTGAGHCAYGRAGSVADESSNHCSTRRADAHPFESSHMAPVRRGMVIVVMPVIDGSHARLGCAEQQPG